MRYTTLLLLTVLLTPAGSAAQTGKIAGRVTEVGAGDALPGATVVVVDEDFRGTTTDAEGYYTILNLAPGTYTIRATFVGFTPHEVQNVDVDIDLTSTINFELQEATIGLDEVVVQSETPIIQRDISANVANLNADDIRNIPVASVGEVVELQAGVESGLSIRGSGMDEVAMLVDGMTTGSGRDNTPWTGISYTSVQEIQVQTGGFNAEHGNVRSGLINVVTREGPRERYTLDVLARFSNPSDKYFDDNRRPNDPDAFWMRPYLDPDVALTGTESGEWDPYIRNQYPEWEGWNAVSERLNSDEDPSNDLTADQLLDVFRWDHRKDLEVTLPDYEVDASIGGPLPAVSSYLGDLRFFASYRRTQSAYSIPQNRDAYRDQMGQLKLTSNIAPAIKVSVSGLINQELGINSTDAGGPSMFRDGSQNYYNDWFGGRGGDVIFADDRYGLMDINRNRVGFTVTHTLSSATFYQIQGQRMYTDYFTRPDDARSSDIINQIGPMGLTEAPLGWEIDPASTLTGMKTGAELSMARDTSWAATWSGKFDLTSQFSRNVQFKSGVDYILTQHRSNHREWVPAYAYRPQPAFIWYRKPQQGAVYTQGKFEFEGLIANLGLRLDYFNAGGKWYAHSAYDRALSAAIGYEELDVAIEQFPVDRQLALSPRLGVSFPITAQSKLYFNYGHFRQMLNPDAIFIVEHISSGAVSSIGNPDHPMPKTIAYELGYERNLADLFLLRLTGYYKDITEQPRAVGFESIDGLVDYSKRFPYNYSDTRGVEISLEKNRGWVRGFANFTYMARKSGNFGFGQYYENPVDQRDYIRESNAHYQSRPVPEPYARFNIQILAPSEFGPQILGAHPLANWIVSSLGDWRAGDVMTWDGGGRSEPELENNVRWRDHYSFDLRFSREFITAAGQAQIFVDIDNIFNRRELNGGGSFIMPNDQERYMQSLHLDADLFEVVGGAPYEYIPGDDRPGDYRKPGIDFIPIEIVDNVDDVNSPYARPLYFEKESQTYMTWNGQDWAPADAERVEYVLDNKAYIDMPNMLEFAFLNPRHITFGIRVTL
jgi:hypothetical protein